MIKLLRTKKWQKIIKKSNLFDVKFYLFSYPDVRAADIDPIEHFVKYGALNGRNPSNEFNTSFYLEQYEDVRESGINPLVHFLLQGKAEGRLSNKDELYKQIIETSGLFDEAYYLSIYPDVKSAEVESIMHYVKYGAVEGRNPSKEFDTVFYLEQYEDVRESRMNPLVHYCLYGKNEKRITKKDTRTLEENSLFNFLFNKNNNRSDEYIDFENKEPVETDVKLIAFYLPQFYPIPQNDIAWGKGFTEWTNVSKALPQYEGHYQPRLPGELGFYDLRLVDIQKRQIELAKNYGLHGFCYHYYWFDGKKILDRPLQQVLNHPELDFPFCINWANENWTKRWDGLEQDVILRQNHMPEDDIAFLDAIKPIFCDKRYIRIDGKALLMIYRPQLFPDIKATVERWRKYAQKIGIGELYLVLTHSFDSQDPRKIGFDAATEFPPNNFHPENITENVKRYNPDFQGMVYDFDSIIRYSREYNEPDYVKFRGIVPSWDNEARKPGKGSNFLNATPKKFGDWLESILDYTHLNRRNSEKIVFINAWNEWAEGAYLEPDRKLGYAYLEAVYQSLKKYKIKKRKILIVAHDAHQHGAQHLILNSAKVLHESMGFIVEMIVLGDGPLIKEYRKYANVHELAGCDIRGKETVEIVQQLSKQGISSAITNTTVTGLIVPVLKQCGFTVVSLIHELPQLIKDYQLQEHVKVIANEADKIVFAAKAVKNGFESFTKLDEKKVVLRPQGLYKKNSLQTSKQIQTAHQALRKRFNLPEKAKIILGVGFADYRKGIDIFVESGIEILKNNKNTYFLWLGNFESHIEIEIKQMIEVSGFDNHFIFPGLDYDSDIYFAGADIYALTSREDPFPSVVMESLDALTPVVAFTKSGGAVELLSKCGGVLVDEMNPYEFSKSLLSLIENPKKIYQLGHEGKKVIDEEFSFRKYLFELTSLAQTGLKHVSVVIPNYNYDQYIKERLQTIFNQSYPIYEIIILDDASSDNSINVIKDLIQDQVIDCKLIINNNNTGNAFKQWRKGVDLATGDFVWIAEADDLAEPEFIELVMKPFQSADIVLSYCESMLINSKGDVLSQNYHAYVADISQEKWVHNYVADGEEEIQTCLAIKNTIPNVSGVVFKRDVIQSVLEEHINEITDYRVAGDWLTYIFVLKKGRIAYTASSLNRHRRHEGGVTLGSFDISQLKEIISVQKLVQERFVLDNEITNKSKTYAQSLYEQFELSSESMAKVSDHPELVVFYK